MASDAKEMDSKSDGQENIGHSDSGDDGESNVVTMVDVLEEEEELEENAFAVLANSDDKHCTYNKGYMGRQALYACKTCNDNGSDVSGVCLACSYECHEGHQLFELYTKRNFRCDCGNDRQTDVTCKLCPKKDAKNEKNTYNHNFTGVYCVCNRPYPDPDNDTDDEMIQCIICEDWFHSQHLEMNLPENGEFSEMICTKCMDQNSFLQHYVPDQKLDGKTSNDIVESSSNDIKVEVASDSGFESSCDSIVGPSSSSCELVKKPNRNLKGATFWSEGWREKLCKCKQCLALYSEKNCSFLLNCKDTVHYYEEQGKVMNVKETQYEKGLSALKKLDRIQQVEALTEYTSMKDELREYLKKFAENKKVVREEDIKEFFENFKTKKRQKVDMSYTCR